MLRKLNLKRSIVMAAALTMAGLSTAASAQRLSEPRPECMAEVRAYCAQYWNARHYPQFASESACVQAYTEQCHYEWSYYYVEAVAPQSAVTARRA